MRALGGGVLEPWELILHHTYSGTPGVIFDHSPGRGAPGVAVGLDPTDFLTDGATAGSGAVRFFRRKAIRVTPTRGWDHLGAFAAEVTFKAEVDEARGRLFTGEQNFFAALFNGDTIDFGFRAGSDWQRFPVRFDEAGVDPRDWTTARIVHDGISRVQLTLNGSVAGVWEDRPLRPVATVPALTIGNEWNSSLGFDGLIDDDVRDLRAHLDATRGQRIRGSRPDHALERVGPLDRRGGAVRRQRVAQRRRPAGMVDMAMGQQDALDRHAQSLDGSQDPLHISAGIDDGRLAGRVTPEDRAILLEGRHRNDLVLQHGQSGNRARQ